MVQYRIISNFTHFLYTNKKTITEPIGTQIDASRLYNNPELTATHDGMESPTHTCIKDFLLL